MAIFSRALVLIFLLFKIIEATEFQVGGKTDAWKIPSSQSQSLNKWAQNSRFQVGDTLVWHYDAEKDSVLKVSKEDFSNCNTSSPIEEYNDGKTKVKLDTSGPFYFISGAKGHCEQGQKVIVVVLSPRRQRFFATSPAPSPVEFEGPAVAPTSSAANLKAGLILMVLGILGLGVVLM